MLEELRGAIDELVGFVEANEPQLIAYSVYLSDDGRQMTVDMSPGFRVLEYHTESLDPPFEGSRTRT